MSSRARKVLFAKRGHAFCHNKNPGNALRKSQYTKERLESIVENKLTPLTTLLIRTYDFVTLKHYHDTLKKKEITMAISNIPPTNIPPNNSGLTPAEIAKTKEIYFALSIDLTPIPTRATSGSKPENEYLPVSDKTLTSLESLVQSLGNTPSLQNIVMSVKQFNQDLNNSSANQVKNALNNSILAYYASGSDLGPPIYNQGS